MTIGERGRTLHLWFQPQTRGHVTNLQAKPDIAVTFRPVCDATGGNIQRVVEVKHVRKLRSLSVRQEFAKAFDLSVCSYCLLTYFPIPANIRSGADKFGLDVAELFIKPGMTPAELVSHVCERLKESRNAERFTTNRQNPIRGLPAKTTNLQSITRSRASLAGSSSSRRKRLGASRALGLRLESVSVEHDVE